MKRIFEDKRIKEVFDYCFENYPSYLYHIESKLNLLRYERQIGKCAEIIPKNARVLDLGCGLGHISIILKIMRPDLKIIGIDISKKPYWKKLKKFKCKFMKGNALNLKFKKESFDAVISFGVMEHTENEKRFLSEIYRILKKRGINLMFNLPNKYSMNEFAAKILETPHKNRYTKKQVKKLFSEAGFIDIKIIRESLLPAQVNEVSKFLGNISNRVYKFTDILDRILVKTILNFFAQSYFIVCRK